MDVCIADIHLYFGAKKMSLIIAGERSGVGKTIITLALLANLHRRSCPVQSFKVGPDYIDPMFHTAITQKPCRNLDPVLTSDTYVQHCFAHHSAKSDYALVEGVMALFDGAAGTDLASTAHVARLLQLPILLVLDCSRLSRSVAAIVHGYRSFDPSLQIAGVVLNRVGSDRHIAMLTNALAPLGIPILGIIRRQDSLAIPDRHLGLIPTDELPHLQSFFDHLADLAETCFDWPRLLPLLQTHPQERCTENVVSRDVQPSQGTCRIAIARDAAFNFYYADNLELLQQYGAELLPWSPLANEPLPSSSQGVYLGGGFPEVFAAKLAKNLIAQRSLQQAIKNGLPTYAECGGLMYLCEAIVNQQGEAYPMVGILPTTATMQPRLSLGYRKAITLNETIFLKQGAAVSGHEFHHSSLTQSSDFPVFSMRSLDNETLQKEGWKEHNVHASYLHLHWGETPQIAQSFVKACSETI
jgi:cobyrinic acid a,c-diamide synthase